MAQPSLRVRKLADKSVGERVTRFDPETGAAYLTDPETWDRYDESTWVENPWPLLGIEVEEAPKTAELPLKWVLRGRAEGWLTIEGETVVHRPGGPPENPWVVTHTFVQGDAIVLHGVDGDVRYTVVDSPDKWPAEKNERDEGFGGDVRWFFKVKRA